MSYNIGLIMKRIFSLIEQLLNPLHKVDTVVPKGRSFFDYSSSEKIKIMRAAGRSAQKEQEALLRAYSAKFG